VAGERKAVYLAAVSLGLRRGELRALRWGDVHLDAVKPFLVARASTTKNGKVAHMWLRDDVVEELRKMAPVGVSDAEPVWGKRVPSMDQYRLDLAAAEIAVEDEQGRVVDFHCLRHTLGTNLARSGVEPRVAMEMLRHSEMSLTQKVYVDAGSLPMLGVMDKLPRFGVAAVSSMAVAVGGGGGTQNGAHNLFRGGVSVSASVTGPRAVKDENPSILPGKSDCMSPDVRLGTDVLKAGDLGFEPRQSAPEALVLPLHQSPKRYLILALNRAFVNFWSGGKCGGGSV